MLIDRLNCDEINFPDSWTLLNVVPAQLVINRELDQVVKIANREVEARFNPTQSLKLTNMATSSRRVTSFRTPFSTSNSIREHNIQRSRISYSNIPHQVL